jgi:hypothetical protein
MKQTGSHAFGMAATRSFEPDPQREIDPIA